MPTVSVFVPQARVLCARQFTRVANEAMKLAPPVGNGVYSVLRLATEAIGSCDVRIKNAVTGSRYRVEVSGTGATVADGTVPSGDFSVSVPYYAPGNSNNTLTIKIRNASGTPAYRPFETQAEAGAGGVIVYVSQALDE